MRGGMKCGSDEKLKSRRKKDEKKEKLKKNNKKRIKMNMPF